MALTSAIAYVSAAQPTPVQPQKQRGYAAPDEQYLLPYLRCDEVPLNQFGEATAPKEALTLLFERALAAERRGEEEKEKKDEMPRIVVEVWPVLIHQHN